jgi:hypothetical protein
MKHLPCYGDHRIVNACAFCGGETGSRDHCPSRVLLDDPFPDNLPIIPACVACNSSFSADEEYLACLISCVIAGSTEPKKISRVKVQRILEHRPALRTRIEQACHEIDGTSVFEPEVERVDAVLTKLAQGHALYEIHETCAYRPDCVECLPLALMSREQRDVFDNPKSAAIWPEIGSRAMQRLVTRAGVSPGGWIHVQRGLYRYHVTYGSKVEVRIVIHEYLASYICWER